MALIEPLPPEPDVPAALPVDPAADPLVPEPVVLPAVDPVVLPVDPEPEYDEPLAPPEPIRALVNTNAAPRALDPVADDPAVDDEPLPDVPTAPPIWLPCCRQPVIVIVSALLLPLRLDCDPVVDEVPDWAAAPPPSASARAATPPIHTFRFMLPPPTTPRAVVQHSFHREKS